MRELHLSVELAGDVPDEDPDVLDAQRAGLETVVLKLWLAGRLSTRQAAQRLGLSYHEYLDLLQVNGLPAVNEGPIREDVVQQMMSQLRSEGRVRD